MASRYKPPPLPPPPGPESMTHVRNVFLFCFGNKRGRNSSPRVKKKKENVLKVSYLSSCSSLSSLFGVSFSPPFLARGHPDKLGRKEDGKNPGVKKSNLPSRNLPASVGWIIWLREPDGGQQNQSTPGSWRARLKVRLSPSAWSLVHPLRAQRRAALFPVYLLCEA